MNQQQKKQLRGRIKACYYAARAAYAPEGENETLKILKARLKAVEQQATELEEAIEEIVSAQPEPAYAARRGELQEALEFRDAVDCLRRVKEWEKELGITFQGV